MTDKTPNTPPDTLRIDSDLRDFLRCVRAGQCLALAAWAAQTLRAGVLTTTDVERCIALGFQG